ncbi:hybrid sensor histidine kinase/response regulator [Catenovulum maritimum]|uniref:histidine kinase n=1 Tax=Catenovulum maritimum TaxID=1513271 RepID=A0A0J8JIA7_9ALTE|nr:hybrid sensor histidine kinase/response regulator [Catenovulum maritimum]KMT64191.1 hypothetical protein XM47_15595 [Catenovulum maritimum]
MKLSHKILIFVILIIATPMVIVGFFAYSTTQSSIKTQASLAIKSQLQQQAITLGSYLDTIHSALSLLSSSHIVSEYITIKSEQHRYAILLAPLLEQFAQYSDSYQDFYEFRIVRPDGLEDARFSTTFGNNKSQNESNMLWYQEIKQTHNKFHFSIETNPDTQSIAIFAVEKLFDSNNVFSGYLVATIEPSVFQNIMDETLGDTGIAMMLDTDGEIILSNKAKLRNQFLPKFFFEKVTASAQSHDLLEVHFNNIDMVFEVKSLPLNLFLVSGISIDELSKSSRDLSIITILTVVTMVIIATFLTYFLIQKTILGPIARLDQASKQVGDGQLTIRLPVKRNDEIGSLFSSFNKMVSSLNTSNQSIQDYKDHLEEKVDSRTLALKNANTELINARQTAEQANELKSRFLANMSHEIRTPLTAIQGFSEHALHSATDVKQKDELISKVVKNSIHLTALLNDILDLSKIESGKLDIEQIDTHLFDLIDELNGFAEPLCAEKSIDFNLYCEYPLPVKFVSDPTRLRQILFNLTSNAIKFTQKGHVTITLEYVEKYKKLVFQIQDTGIGMSPEELNKLFKPFTQADTSTTRHFGGTGLGLAISRHLAGYLNSEISVKSEKGIGSLFVFSMDLSNQDVELIAERINISKIDKSVSPTSVLDLSKSRLLIAEDNPDNQTLIKLILQPTKVDYTLVNNGSEAVEIALSEDFDMILMDMQMPVMGGLEATKMLRQLGYDGPIIALTANSMKSETESYLSQGCDACVAKPIDTKELFKQLQHFLKAQAQIFDFADFQNRITQSEDYQKMKNNFESGLTNTIIVFNQLIEVENYQELSHEAHKLKGTSGNMGWSEITELASTIEIAANKQDVETIKKATLELSKVIEEKLTRKHHE